MTEPVRLFVDGVPVPQGSKSAYPNPRTGRIMMVEGKGAATKRHKQWRSDVRAVAVRWVEHHPGFVMLDEPVRLRAVFYLPRPKSYPAWRWIPSARPDLSKLARSIEDSLSDVIYRDDARISDLSVAKRYALDRGPGVSIIVDGLGAEERRFGDLWQALGGPVPKLNG